jgi:hypothetical protein
MSGDLSDLPKYDIAGGKPHTIEADVAIVREPFFT